MRFITNAQPNGMGGGGGGGVAYHTKNVKCDGNASA